MNLPPPIPIDTSSPAPSAERLANLAAGADPIGKQTDRRAELIQAAKDFESVLLDRLLSEMKRTIPQSGLLEGQGSGQVWDLFWSQLARDIGSRGGLGLWKQLAGQFGADFQAPSESQP